MGHAVKTSESKKDGYINEKGEVVEGVNPDPCKYDTVKTYDCDHYNVNGAQNLCNLKDGKVVELQL